MARSKRLFSTASRSKQPPCPFPQPSRRRVASGSPNPEEAGSAWFGRLRKRLRHFDELAVVWNFLCIGVALALIPRALSTFGLQRVVARLDAAPRGSHRLEELNPASVSIEQARRLAVFADYWLRRLRSRNPCLRRSLVLFARLRRAGLPVNFCLGIRKNEPLGVDDPVQGHAWLELDGCVVLEPEAAIADYARTYCYPPLCKVSNYAKR